MPNLLAIDCPPDFVLSMAQTENWSVMAGYQESDCPKALREKLTPPPDPMTWNLVVDDSGKQNFSDWSRIADAGIPLVRIPDDYIEECDRARAIRLCRTQGTVTSWVGASTSGYRTLEFNATSDTRALHLIDFIEAFEADFLAGHLTSYSMTSGNKTDLYEDVYGYSVVALEEDDIECLVLLDIPDKERRSEALTYLCTRTAPKLWGDLYSGHFFPAKVIALQEQRDKLQLESRAELAALDSQIEEEQAKYAPYVNLLYVGDDALKDLVAAAFRDVFGAKVQDLDTLTEEDDPKRLDLAVNLQGVNICVEVRGRANRNAQLDDIEKFEHNLELMTDAAKYKAKLLVFNGMYRRSDEERGRVQTFSNDIVDEAMAVKMGLLSTRVLLELVEARLAGKLNDSDLIERLTAPGVNS